VENETTEFEVVNRHRPDVGRPEKKVARPRKSDVYFVDTGAKRKTFRRRTDAMNDHGVMFLGGSKKNGKVVATIGESKGGKEETK